MKVSVKTAAKLKKIRLLIMDVDGTLTDGRMIATADKVYVKNFHSHDGYGLSLARAAGLRLAIITAKNAQATKFRAADLKIDDVIENRVDKKVSYAALKKKYKLKDSQVAYIGDDWMDIPVIKKCGFGVCVADGRTEVKKAADHVTKADGGHGAVRELVEMILKAQGKLKVPE